MEMTIRSMTPGGASRRPGHHRRSWAHRRALVLGAVAVLTAATFGLAVARTAEAGTVGAGSYADTLPAGRALPVGCGNLTNNPRQYVTANAPAGGVPTNDWWSSLLFKKFDCSYSEPLHAHPTSYDTFAGGLGFSYNTTAAISGSATGPGEFHYPYVQDILVGVAGLNSPDTKVDGWSDWTVTPYWSDGARTMKATIGHGLPFSYFQITGGNAQITAVATPTVWSNTGGQLGFNVNGRDYVAYAPSGSTWTVSGTTISSTLNGQGFFSVAVLPAGADRAALATTYGQYAHAHVTGTRVSYSYNQAASTLNTTYTYLTTARQGSQTATVAALYPHQWNHLTGASPLAATYTSARGQMKILTGIGSFTTSMKYTGVLPEIPAVADSSGGDLTTITNYLNAVAGNPADFRGDDTYWTGKGLGRAARIAEIADQLGLTSVRDTALSTIRTRLNDWFTASAGKTSRVFYYNSAWGTLIGYPASYGSDQELNDHHFHYGYYVAAAATLAKFDPTWATNSQYGGMVDLLIRDANNYDRNDTRFPYLRDFDIFAGHDWAAGHGAFGAGNNQESSSEGMNFANALIQWGQATGNTTVRDAGIFIYTTQSAAIAEYWFDVRNQNFPAAFGHNTVGMVWGDGGAYATWFSGEPEMIQGINMLPITGGHFYLGDNPAYVQTNYNELVTNNGGAPTVWQDILWEFLALGNGQTALNNFNANPGFTSEEGESKAHTYHWIRNLAALGNVDTTVTANHPLAKVFTKSGVRTYVASNIGNSAITVTFSNGTTLNVPACKTVTSGAFTWSGGGACGGTNPSPSNPPSSPPASPSPSPSAPPSPSPSTSPNPPGNFAATRYLTSGGGLPGTAGAAGSVTVAAANGNWDGNPHSQQTFTATGLSANHNGGATNFDMFVDAGTGVGNATQVRVSYDFTGNGSWDRLETYNYFPTDPVAGYEHYTQASGVKTTSGAFANLANGSVRVEVWSAIGSTSTTLGIGNQSRVVLPYTGTTSQPSVNVALNKPTLTSSNESATYGGPQAVDGNATTTRWSSTFSDPQWLRVDLGQTYSISRVRLVWEAAYGSAYQIQTSPDGNTWTTIRSVTGGDGGVDDLTGLSGSGRYVRVNGTTRATAWGYSLFEFEVYAP